MTEIQELDQHRHNRLLQELKNVDEEVSAHPDSEALKQKRQALVEKIQGSHLDRRFTFSKKMTSLGLTMINLVRLSAVDRVANPRDRQAYHRQLQRESRRLEVTQSK